MIPAPSEREGKQGIFRAGAKALREVARKHPWGTAAAILIIPSLPGVISAFLQPSIPPVGTPVNTWETASAFGLAGGLFAGGMEVAASSMRRSG